MRRFASLIMCLTLTLNMSMGVLADTLYLPDFTWRIEEQAFEGNKSLDKVQLPDGIERIESRAFADSSLRTINLPGSLTYIADDAFDESITEIQFNTEVGSYGETWVNGDDLHFTDDWAYTQTVYMAIFRDEEEKGLFSDPWVYYYEVEDANYPGEPEWNVTVLEGDDPGYFLDSSGREASLLVAMPSNPCEVLYEVKCTWDGHTAISRTWVNYVFPDSLPYGTDIPDVLSLSKEEDNIFYFSFDPSDYSFGSADRVGFSPAEGEEVLFDTWYEGHEFHIIPHETGSFHVMISLYCGNIYIIKEVLLEVENIRPQMDDEIWRNVILTGNTGEYETYLDEAPEIDIFIDNITELREAYGDTFSWSFETVEGVDLSLSGNQTIEDWGLTLSVNDFDQMVPDSDALVKATLKWGENSSTTLIHIGFSNVPLPDWISFDTDFTLAVGIPYEASVTVSPSDWFDDYFLYYDFEEDAAGNFSLEGEHGPSITITALEPGHYRARPHIHVGANLYIFGDWFEFDVEADGISLIERKAREQLDLIRSFDGTGVESLYIPDEVLTLLPTDGITDEEELEKIRSFNENQLERQVIAAEYNETIDQLLGEIQAVYDEVGISALYEQDGRCILEGPGYHVELEESVGDLITGDFVVEEVVNRDDKIYIKVQSGEGHYYIVQSDSTIELLTFVDPDADLSGGGIVGNSLMLVSAPGDPSPPGAAEWDHHLGNISLTADISQLLMNEFIRNLGKYSDYFDWDIIGSMNGINNLVGYIGAVAGYAGSYKRIWDDEFARVRMNNIISYHGHLTPFEKAEPYSVGRYNELVNEIENYNRISAYDLAANLGSIAVNVGSLFVYTYAGNRLPYGAKQAMLACSISMSLLSAWQQRLLEESKQRIQDLDAELHYDVTGVVKDSEGNAISNVQVESGNVLTFTDENGMFSLEVPHSSASLTFTKAQYKEKRESVSGIIPYNASFLPVELEDLVTHGFYMGQVIDQRTGEPLEGVEVSLGENLKTWTDPSGNFSIRIPLGDWYAVFSFDGYYPEDDSFTLDYDHIIEEKEIKMTAEEYGIGYLTGYVKDKDTREPISDVKISCGSSNTKSTQTGYFTINLYVGNNKVHFEKTGYETEEVDVFIEKGKAEEIEVLLAAKTKGTIHGTVTDTEGHLIGGARIQVYNNNNQMVADVYTNDSGMYSVDVNEGQYIVTASKDGYLTEGYQRKITKTCSINKGDSREVSFRFRDFTDTFIYNVWTCLFIVEVYKGILPTRLEGHVDAPNIQVSWAGGSATTDETGRCYIPFNGDELKVRCIGHVSYTGDNETKSDDIDTQITIHKDSEKNLYWLEVGGFSFRYS